MLHICAALGFAGFFPSFTSRLALDQLELVYLGSYFLLAAAIFLYSYRQTPSGFLRQQLKWITGGTLAGMLPFAALYILPFSLGAVPRPVDEPLGAVAGAGPVVFRLRHRALSPDGRGHHLQARLGLYRGDRGHHRGLLSPWSP